MKALALLLVSGAAFLGLATTDGSARPQTTAPGGYVTVRLIVTNKAVTINPSRVRRGQTAIFLVSNLASSTRVISIGDVSLKHHRGTGFAIRLGRNQQRRILCYLDYRGPLPAAVGDGRRKAKVMGVFFVT